MNTIRKRLTVALIERRLYPKTRQISDSFQIMVLYHAIYFVIVINKSHGFITSNTVHCISRLRNINSLVGQIILSCS